jgi:transcriptional regulator NrdR family protein
MAGRGKMRLKVIKADGTEEEYLHTKVIRTISHALDRIEGADMNVAEQIAEVVTYYLYSERGSCSVTSGEIFSMIQAVLTATGHERAAILLSDYHLERRLRRNRIEVVGVEVRELADAEALCLGARAAGRSQWDKSRIVEGLVEKYNLSRQTARTIASLVEEKVFGMNLSLVPASLIRQLVLSDTAAILEADRQLEMV